MEEPRHITEGIAPGILQAKQAFYRDLPAMLQNPKHDRWCAAYHQDERIGIAPSEVDLIKECLKRGLKGSEYFIGIIVPHDSDEDEEIETSLYEFDSP